MRNFGVTGNTNTNVVIRPRHVSSVVCYNPNGASSNTNKRYVRWNTWNISTLN